MATSRAAASTYCACPPRRWTGGVPTAIADHLRPSTGSFCPFGGAGFFPATGASALFQPLTVDGALAEERSASFPGPSRAGDLAKPVRRPGRTCDETKHPGTDDDDIHSALSLLKVCPAFNSPSGPSGPPPL